MKKLVSLFILVIPTLVRADVVYVKEEHGGTTGSSWTDAFSTLQEALDAVDPGDDIWVAAGTYYPADDYGLGIGDRGGHFRMKNNVGIYGGFEGDETLLSQRDIDKNETILSGDIGVAGDSSDNCYHVFYQPAGTGLDATATLDGFTITAGNADGSGDHDHGGGMYNDVSDLTVINCTFTGNSAEFGGGMFNSGSQLTISHCTFSDNTAQDRGGGMRNLGGAPLVTDCTFTGNSAVHGGGIYSYCSSTPTVDGCTFTGNSADYGGGINNNASDATVLNSTFTDNVTLRGGGVYNTYSTPTINNCTFSSNSADCGGGMNNENSDPNVTNCVFNANTVSEYGGGMRNFGSNATVTDCAFSGNTANEYGGGMYNNDNEPMITNCSFIGNSAHDGGGMYNYRSSPTVTNCIFSSNAADLFGGGMYTRYDNLTITNCSFSTNASGWFGGGMYNQEVDPTVTNCILWGNTAVSSGSQLFNGGTSSTPVISYSDIEDCGGSGAGWNSALGTDGGGNIDADPLFVDADGIGENNLRLHAGSPCIDAGDNSAISETTDRDGNPRKVNDPATTDTGSGTAPIVDMGAYEFLQAIAKLMRGQSATLIPNGQSGPPTKDAQVYFENISGPILLQSLVRVRQYNTDLHYSSYAFSFMGITLMVETTLADGRFFATIKIPFNKVDLGGNNWKLFDLRYWNGNTWTLAVRGNTQDSPGHLGPAGDRFVDEAPTIPPLSSDLGDYGVYWNPMTEKGFVWANVDHTTDFAGVWLLGDFEPDYDVDLSDLSVFVMWWNASCGMPDYCEGADLDHNGRVDLEDFARFAQNCFRHPGI